MSEWDRDRGNNFLQKPNRNASDITGFFRLKQVCGIFNLGGTHGNFVKTKDWNVVVTFVIWWANRGINIIYNFGRDRGKKFITMISQVI